MPNKNLPHRLVSSRTFPFLTLTLFMSSMPLIHAAPTATVEGTLPLAVGDGANIVVQGNQAYVSDENFGITGGGMFIIDISDPAHPVLSSQTPLGSKPQTILGAVDVTDDLPGNFDPFGVVVGTFEGAESTREFAFVSGGFL